MRLIEVCYKLIFGYRRRVFTDSYDAIDANNGRRTNVIGVSFKALDVFPNVLYICSSISASLESIRRTCGVITNTQRAEKGSNDSLSDNAINKALGRYNLTDKVGMGCIIIIAFSIKA